MSFLLLAKKKLYSPIFTPHINPPLRSLLLRLSASATQTPDPNTLSLPLVDYLVSTFGFSPHKAAAICKPIAYFKSPHNPYAVCSFFQSQGFHDSQIKTIITGFPNILCSSLESTILPNLTALRDIGLSTSALAQIIVSSPRALQLSSAIPRINFWRDFVAGDEVALVKIFRCNIGLVNHDINKGIATKISLLQSHGISSYDIQRIICTARKFLTSSVSRIEELLNRTKGFGFQPESGMFALGLRIMASYNRDALEKKMEFLESFGWSKEELLSIFNKNPSVFGFSKEKLRVKMDFLLGEANCDLSYITFRPKVLNLSLEKRLRPRYQVLCVLETNNLSNKKKEFRRAIELTESKFVERYILRHKDTIPELHKLYLTASASGSR